MNASFREVLSELPLVDHHAHGILRAPPASLDEFRGLFSESGDPRQWPHIATGVTYRRAIRVLATQLGCEPTEQAVYEHRRHTDPAEYARVLLRATNTELLLVDDGFPPPDVGTTPAELGELAGCPARPVMRIERVAEEVGPHALGALAETVTGARARGYAALKTIAAYRGGLDLEALRPPVRTDRLEGAPLRAVLTTALEANEATGDPLPVQVHTGFGDEDLLLPAARPGLLKPLIERFSDTTFVLLHCYPFVREAGWLAHVYGNVFFDLSLTIPHVARPAAVLAEALELAPISKLLYASDAARTPELYLLAATWWRDALAAVLPPMLEDDDAALDAARLITHGNACQVYRLGVGGQEPSAERSSFEALYRDFNARDLEAVVARMTDDVEWPNAWEGGYVHGREAVRAYWTRQWTTIDPTVTPLAVRTLPDERIDVEVHQVVRDRDGFVVSDRTVHHVYRLCDGYIAHMEIVRES